MARGRYAKAYFHPFRKRSAGLNSNVGHSAAKIDCVGCAQTLTLSSIEIRPYHFYEMVTETALIDFDGSRSTAIEERRGIDKQQ